MELKPHIAILAAGKGKRMHSTLPKVLHPVLFRPMLHYVLDVALQLPHRKIYAVVGHGEAEVRKACSDYPELEYVVQREQRGTAHAVRQLEPSLKNESGTLLILCGDVILLRESTLRTMMESHVASGAACTLLSAQLDKPKGYGRILRNSASEVRGIREEADCSPEERNIREVNCGIYLFDIPSLFSAISQINDSNRQGEFYLTDVIEIFVKKRLVSRALILDDPMEMTGINDRLALQTVERTLQGRVNEAFMLAGVRLQSPETTFLDPRCQISADVVIEGGCQLINSKVAAGVTIESQCRVMHSTIESNTHLKQGSYIESSVIASDCSVGPYAHLRPGSRLSSGVKIGNFVELKNSRFGEGSKASHLSYIGDAEIGRDVNLGCGFITCNYDGVSKHKTIIEDGVFVGSDSQAIAPITLGKGSYIASGTTLTEDVPPDSLAIARSPQKNKVGYASRLKGLRKRSSERESSS